MRESRRANLLIFLSLTAILGSAAVYASIIYSWLHKPAGTAARTAAKPVSAELAAARLRFRERLLDPEAALALSEALYKANRPVDSFYVENWARSFYGPSPFQQAHDAVVLRRETVLGGQPYDPSPENESRLRALVKVRPARADAWAYLSRIDLDKQDAKAALGDVEQGLQAVPDDRALLLAKARLTAPSDPEGAIGLYVRVANAHPDSYEGRQSLQDLRSLAALKDDAAAEASGDAREALQELLQAKPSDPFIFAALALSSWDRGDAAAARALVAQTLAQKPNQAGALLADGTISWAQGDADAALKRFAAAFEKNPEDAYSAQKLAEAFDKEGISRDAALPYYVALYRQQPDAAEEKPVEEIISDILAARGDESVSEAEGPALEKYFQSEDGFLRAQACARAGRLQDERLVAPLGELLDDDDEPVRRAAREALIEIGRRRPEALDARADAWLSDMRPLVRAGALSVLAELNWDKTRALAFKALRDQHPAVRFFAYAVIRRHSKGDPKATKAMAEYLASEKDPDVLARCGVSR